MTNYQLVSGPCDSVGIEIFDIVSLFKILNFSKCIFKDKFHELKKISKKSDQSIFFSFSSLLNKDSNSISLIKSNLLVPLKFSTSLPSEDLFNKKSEVIVKYRDTYGFIYNTVDAIFGLLSNDFDFIENSENYPDHFLNPPEVAEDEFLFLSYQSLIVENPDELFIIIKRKDVQDFYYIDENSRTSQNIQIKVKTEPKEKPKAAEKQVEKENLNKNSTPKPDVSLLSNNSTPIVINLKKDLELEIKSPQTPSVGLGREDIIRSYTTRSKNYCALKKETNFTEAYKKFFSSTNGLETILKIPFEKNLSWKKSTYKFKQIFLTPSTDESELQKEVNLVRNLDYFERSDMNIHLFYNQCLLEDWSLTWQRLESKGWLRINKDLFSNYISKVPILYRNEIEKYDDIFLYSPILQDPSLSFTPGVNLFVSELTLKLFISRYPYLLQDQIRFLETLILHNWEFTSSIDFKQVEFDFESISVKAFRAPKTYTISELLLKCWINPAFLFQNYKQISSERFMESFQINFLSYLNKSELSDTTVSKLDFTDNSPAPSPKPIRMTIPSQIPTSTRSATLPNNNSTLSIQSTSSLSPTTHSSPPSSPTDTYLPPQRILPVTENLIKKSSNTNILNDPKYPKIINNSSSLNTFIQPAPNSPIVKRTGDGIESEISAKRNKIEERDPKTPHTESHISSIQIMHDMTPVQNHISSFSVTTPITTPHNSISISNPTPKSTTRTPMTIRPPPSMFKK